MRGANSHKAKVNLSIEKKNRNTQKKPVCDEKKNMAAIKSTIITNF